MIPRPPRITSAELSAWEAPPGVPVSCAVEWTGFPRAQPTFQWRNGLARIRGATGSAYTPAADTPLLNCMVKVDNGVGQACAVAILLDVPAPETPTGPDPASLYVESGYVEGGYVA